VSASLSIAFLSHLASARAPTGAEHSLALLAGALARRGHRVAVVAPGPWILAERLRSVGVEVETVRSRACWMTYWEPRPWPVAFAKWMRCVWPQRATSRLRVFLRGWRPDVVHVNCLPHLPGAVAGAGTGRPVVWHLREILPEGRRRRWLARRLARHASAVVAVSEAVAGWVRAEGLGDRLHVVPNGVEPLAEPPDRPRAREALGLDGAGVIIGLFGQLLPHKGALEFIEAASLAARSSPDLRFVLAGSGTESFRRRCEEAIGRSAAAARFHLLPARPSGEELIAASDVVCLATTTPDPFPRTVLEAMGAGRPVAAFASGGTVEMVRDGETGVLVPVGDVRALSAAFCKLGCDPVLRETMGRAGARLASGVFSLERHVDRMESLMASLAG